MFLNTCRHRGARRVPRAAKATPSATPASITAGPTTATASLYAVPGQSAYPPSFDQDAVLGLKAPPRVDAYRGFVFLNFDADAVPLDEYLGRATEYIDLVLDQSPSGAWR